MAEIKSTPKPESLEAKFKLLALLPYDRRAKRKHSLVFGFILDWYHSKYGDALASVRHVTSTIKERDPAGVGLFAGDIHAALTDLVAWGYLEQEKGTGRRASRYVPVWAKLDSVHKTPNATEDEISVRENANTSVRETPNATADSVRDSMNEDPSTRTRSQDQGTGVDEINGCAAATPPPSAGLEAAEAGTAQENTDALAGFEELYRAYGVRKNKGDARRAYEKLSPSPELHAKMMVAARLWKDAAGDSVERMYLRRWIEDEHYDDEPRAERKPKASKATKEQVDVPTATNSDVPDFMRGSPNLWPAGSHVVNIVEAYLEEDNGDTCVFLNCMIIEGDHYGEIHSHRILVRSVITSAEAEGQATVLAVFAAAGVTATSDLGVLIHRRMVANVGSGRITYEPHGYREAA